MEVQKCTPGFYWETDNNKDGKPSIEDTFRERANGNPVFYEDIPEECRATLFGSRGMPSLANLFQPPSNFLSAISKISPSNISNDEDVLYTIVSKKSLSQELSASNQLEKVALPNWATLEAGKIRYRKSDGQFYVPAGAMAQINGVTIGSPGNWQIGPMSVRFQPHPVPVFFDGKEHPEVKGEYVSLDVLNRRFVLAGTSSDQQVGINLKIQGSPFLTLPEALNSKASGRLLELQVAPDSTLFFDASSSPYRIRIKNFQLAIITNESSYLFLNSKYGAVPRTSKEYPSLGNRTPLFVELEGTGYTYSPINTQLPTPFIEHRFLFNEEGKFTRVEADKPAQQKFTLDDFRKLYPSIKLKGHKLKDTPEIAEKLLRKVGDLTAELRRTIQYIDFASESEFKKEEAKDNSAIRAWASLSDGGIHLRENFSDGDIQHEASHLLTHQLGETARAEWLQITPQKEYRRHIKKEEIDKKNCWVWKGAEKDEKFNPQYGFVRPNGALNDDEDRSSYVDFILEERLAFKQLLEPTSPNSNTHRAKLEFLKKYHYISQKQYDEIFAAATFWGYKLM